MLLGLLLLSLDYANYLLQEFCVFAEPVEILFEGRIVLAKLDQATAHLKAQRNYASSAGNGRKRVAHRWVRISWKHQLRGTEEK